MPVLRVGEPHDVRAERRLGPVNGDGEACHNTAMVERYAFIKLTDEYATETGRAEVASEAERALTEIPGVAELRVGVPADDHARAAWDLSLALRFASASDAEAYRQHPRHREFVDAFLAPRLAVIKAWNMALREPSGYMG